MDFDMKLIFVGLLIAFVIVVGCRTIPPKLSKDTELAPLGYGKTYTLQNRAVKVVVAPEIGRIIHFGHINGRNLIWLNNCTELAKEKNAGTQWLNWGGDKVWPAQQADWSFVYGGDDWPPKTELDGHAFKVVEVSPTKLVMESAMDKALHVRLRRTLTIDATLPRLTIENTLTRQASSPWPVHIWSVTQCLLPNYTFLGIAKEAPDRKNRPFSNLWDAPLPDENAKLMTNALRFSLEENLSIAKAGTIGNWCAGVYSDVIFLQNSDAPANGCYPDGANVEVFIFDRYIELELLSSNTHLQKGESISSTTVWSLIKTKLESTAEENLKLIEDLNRK